MDRLRQQLFRALLHGPATLWELITLQDGDLSAFTSTLQQLAREGLIVRTPEGSLALTEQGRWQASRLLPRQDWECPQCQGKGMVPQGVFARLLPEWEALAASRPAPALNFDQGYIRGHDAVARVVLMYRRADLEGRRLFFLGDDDLTSLAAALTGLSAEIRVLEIDPRLVDFLNRTAESRGWKHFRAEVYDVQQPLPVDYRRGFDVAITDPVETQRGFLLFLSRCAEALAGPGTAIYFGLTRLETDLRKWHAWLKILLDMGLTPTDLLPGFHRYDLENTGFVSEEYPQARPFLPEQPPGRPWYLSALIRLEATESPRPYYQEAVHLGPSLYRD
ncbi:MAG: bis-aminopropyl spermidine synthase family protein [Moorellales bacterium]